MGNEFREGFMEQIREKIESRWKHRARIIGSLGKLEEITYQLALAQETDEISTTPRRLLIFSSSHGISQEAISAYPTEITAQVVLNLLNEGSATNALCRQNHIDLRIIDVGVDTRWPEGMIPHPHFEWKPIRRGTRNFLKEPAMLPSECDAALELGREEVRLAARDGIRLLGLGEVGIGNTTSASALCCATLNLNPITVVGRGTGLSDEALQRKINTVTRSLTIHQSNIKTPLDWLRCVGGFEIAALVGSILEAQHHKIALVIDNFVSTAAAAVAFNIDPFARNSCLFSHKSHERGHGLILQMLGIEALTEFKISMGEGLGAALVMPLIDSAIKIYKEISLFETVHIKHPKPLM